MAGKILLWCCLMFLCSSCNAHYLDIQDHKRSTSSLNDNASEQLSLMLDQMLSARIDTLVANADMGGVSGEPQLLGMPVSSEVRMDSVSMDVAQIHEFNTNGQLQLNCFGGYCDGAQFSGNVAIDVNISAKLLSIHSINIGDDNNLFMLRGSIEKHYGNSDQLLQPGKVAMILSTPSEDITLDQSGTVAVSHLPYNADSAFNGAVELSHELSQSYLAVQIKSVSD